MEKSIDRRPDIKFICPNCGTIDMAPPRTIAIVGCDGCGGYYEN